MLATPDSYRSIGLKFGVVKSVARECVFRVIDALLEVNQERKIILWPNAVEANGIIQEFLDKTKFPGVIGSIDGSHIPIKAPKENSGAYLNRKGFHSIVLQGICSHDMKFIDCEVGQAGAVHDACVLRRSEFFNKTLANPTSFPPDSHVVGDGAYPLLLNIMVPFKDNGNLTVQQRKFNTTLSRARVVIERAFALLKGRFRRLKYVDMRRVDLIPKLVIACCILHNLCIDDIDWLGCDDDQGADSDGEVEPNTEVHQSSAAVAAARKFAIAKRNVIVNTL